MTQQPDHFWDFVEDGNFTEFTRRDAARIEALEKALRSIANFPHTPSKNRAARQMSLIARAALAPETAP